MTKTSGTHANIIRHDVSNTQMTSPARESEGSPFDKGRNAGQPPGDADGQSMAHMALIGTLDAIQQRKLKTEQRIKADYEEMASILQEIWIDTFTSAAGSTHATLPTQPTSLSESEISGISSINCSEGGANKKRALLISSGEPPKESSNKADKATRSVSFSDEVGKSRTEKDALRALEERFIGFEKKLSKVAGIEKENSKLKAELKYQKDEMGALKKALDSQEQKLASLILGFPLPKDSDHDTSGTPTREVTTSDEAAAAPVSDTKMMLDHEDLHGLSQNVSKAEIIDKQGTPPTDRAQALPGRLPSNQSTDEPQTASNITTNSTLSAPTPVFTPRRSPRHSTSSQQNGPASKEIAQIIATSSARASPLARMILPKPEFPFASATPFTLFSTPLPSPSIFQSRTSSPFSSKPIQDPDNSSFPSTQPEAPSRGDISQIAPLPLNNGHSLFSNNPDLTSEGNSTQSRDVEMNDTLEHQSGEASFITHITSGIPNENSSDASQIADLSSIFASPIPKTLPP
ncbi:hypothetical protein FRC17_004005, partial [Serendipita sp. 399]